MHKNYYIKKFLNTIHIQKRNGKEENTEKKLYMKKMKKEMKQI